MDKSLVAQLRQLMNLKICSDGTKPCDCRFSYPFCQISRKRGFFSQLFSNNRKPLTNIANPLYNMTDQVDQ